MTFMTSARLTVAALLGTAMLAGPAAAQTTIRLAHHLQENSEQHLAATRLKELVEERSNGELKMEILPAGQLGGQREIIEGVQFGTIEMGFGESGLYANYVPGFGILTLPYLYTGPEHWEAVVTGEIGQTMVDQLEEATGLVLTNWMLSGYRDTYTTDRVIETPADFEGLKIRVPESPVFIETFAALGAEPTPIPFTELYTALQSGVVAAMEGTPESGMTQRMYEVTKHLNKTRHILFDGSFVTSRMFLDSLSEENQKILMDAAAEVARMQIDEQAAREADWFEKLAETGIEIHDVDPAPFREVLTPVQDAFAEDAGATDALAQIRELGAQ
ncbi:TRAP transporter substrate-binding protein [Acuticoccus sp. I52.16.1]|uniref:TRAP transporter substrate-binding protein n=1 Tax=Acuticoccus sp. I52.16.1 TaxID=2928472 RepID=UPI001FCFBA3D|nr:TRAP transporter substrate-binding protein [Acuticoccus sp. I52.16.1]UOM33252.1 TRAP transporter substrate-binding protein [Acuticoccus sp. I52.16.1]